MDSFEKYKTALIEQTFPEKTVTITDRDLPFMTEELKLIRRQRMSFYRKQGRSEKYLELLDRFDEKLKLEAKKYHQKILDEVAEGNRNNSYAALRKSAIFPFQVMGMNFFPLLSQLRGWLSIFLPYLKNLTQFVLKTFPHGLRKGLRLDEMTGKNLY